MTSTPWLAFAGPAAIADLDTFVGRAKTLDPAGSLRLAAHGSTIALTVCALPGHGLMGEGTVLGLRVMELAQPAEVDIVVGLDAIADRLARMRRLPLDDPDATRLAIPPVPRVEAWAGLSAPREGWSAHGTLEPSEITQIARAGIAAVAQGAPTGSGSAAVAELRRRVWGESIPLGQSHEPGVDGPPAESTVASAAAAVSIPAGAAFAAYSLGFVARGGGVTVHTSGRWLRLTTPSGHVLAR